MNKEDKTTASELLHRLPSLLELGGKKVMDEALATLKDQPLGESAELSSSFAWTHFITELDCSGQNLSTLDLSPYPNLHELWCGHNDLSQLNLSHTPRLNIL